MLSILLMLCAGHIIYLEIFMKKIIMFIFLSFVISGCGDILDVLNSSALDSDGGGIAVI